MDTCTIQPCLFGGIVPCEESNLAIVPHDYLPIRIACRITSSCLVIALPYISLRLNHAEKYQGFALSTIQSPADSDVIGFRCRDEQCYKRQLFWCWTTAALGCLDAVRYGENHC